MKQRLIVYAKRPLPGYAKTRLAAEIGAQAAAGIYARILYAYLLRLACTPLPGIDVELSLAAPDDVPFFAQAFPEFEVGAQAAGDLGQRLAASFRDAFAGGAGAVVVSASDAPGLGPHLALSAFDALAYAPVVIGPCCDGGYYLLGMRAPGAALFEGIDWSTDRVLAQTEALAQARGLDVTRLPELVDIDTTRDLAAWRRAAGFGPDRPTSQKEAR